MSELLTPKFLTIDLAKDVVDKVLRSTLLNPEWKGILRHPFGHIVIVVPCLYDGIIKKHVLYERSVGKKSDRQKPYDVIAQSKALQLWQARNDDGQTDINAHLLFPGDTIYWGGVKRHGIVVGFSGLQPYFDQMISGMVADMLKACARNSYELRPDKSEGCAFLT